MYHYRPISEFLSRYAAVGGLRMHMPGHKGRSLREGLEGAYLWDITEIAGADSLFEASGILRQSERLTAALYGSGDCAFSIGGSTLCIQAMLAAMQGRRVIAARTVHRAFLNACALLGLEVTWVMPRSGGLIGGEYAPEDFAAALAGTEAPACVYVTSPEYPGQLLDIAALAEVCGRYAAPLLVDNAHGAHLAFLEENRHPIALGADLCCDSFHKMLPALTGAAVLHTKAPDRAGAMKQYMQLFGSTSPSYLIMQSIEESTAWLSEGGTAAVWETAARADALREALPQYRWIGDDPLHLTAACDGVRLAEALRGHGIECEYADRSCIVLLLSPMTSAEELDRLGEVLSALHPAPPEETGELPPLPERVCSIREAALAPYRVLPVEEAVGAVCGPVQVPCPPAVPVIVSGERITQEWAAYMRRLGIREIAAAERL